MELTSAEMDALIDVIRHYRNSGWGDGNVNTRDLTIALGKMVHHRVREIAAECDAINERIDRRRAAA